MSVPSGTSTADNAKHNQTGHFDKHGVLHHKHAELCGVSAVVIMRFGYFYIAVHAVPEFAPNFSDTKYGEYGRRDWYTYHVFFSSGIGTSVMSYQGKNLSENFPTRLTSLEAHHDRVKAMHLANNVSITKITHATRALAAQTCRSFSASVSDTQALGGWNESGSFKNCYDCALPVGALLGAAHFSSAKPDLHRVAQDCLGTFKPIQRTINSKTFTDPPNEILKQLFPWIEQEQAALLSRERANPLARDIALHQFLSTMIWFVVSLSRIWLFSSPKLPRLRFTRLPPST
jgi:hypothetical protein